MLQCSIIYNFLGDFFVNPINVYENVIQGVNTITSTNLDCLIRLVISCDMLSLDLTHAVAPSKTISRALLHENISSLLHMSIASPLDHVMLLTKY
jgi:hypothetical protein